MAVAICDRRSLEEMDYPCIVVRRGSNTKTTAKIKELSKTIDLKGLRERKTFSHLALQYHCLVGDGNALLIAVTQREDDTLKRLAYRLLEELDKMWIKLRKGKGGEQREFDDQVMRLMDLHSDRTRDAIGQVNEAVSDAHTEVAAQVERLLNKGERVDHLVSATEEYEIESKKMEEQAKQLRWQRRKRCIAIAIAVIIILVAVGLVGSYFACRNDTDIKKINWDKCSDKFNDLVHKNTTQQS